MNNYLKLNAKLNRGVTLCNFWHRVSKLALRVADFATRQAMKVTKKNIDIVGKMVAEGCSQEIKDVYDDLQQMEL